MRGVAELAGPPMWRARRNVAQVDLAGVGKPQSMQNRSPPPYKRRRGYDIRWGYSALATTNVGLRRWRVRRNHLLHTNWRSI